MAAVVLFFCVTNLTINTPCVFVLHPKLRFWILQTETQENIIKHYQSVPASLPSASIVLFLDDLRQEILNQTDCADQLGVLLRVE